jgi:polar amino acid transport system substrate-binding protein
MIGRMAVVALTCLCFSASPGAAEPFRIAHNQNLPPLMMVQDGKSVGLGVDVLHAAAMRAGIELAFVPLTIEHQLPSLKDGRADGLLSADTPERRQILDFGAPVVMTGGALYVRAPNPTPQTLGVLSGQVVVTPRAGPLTDYIRKNAPAVNLVVTEDYEESLARVMAGQAAAAALNASAGGRIAAQLYPNQFTIPKIMFYEQPLALGVPKGQSAKIIAQLDAGLAAIRADGTWKQINDRWLGQ